MREITKLKRSVKAVSPVISVLLLISIAVVASLIAYAWVTGYIGFQTDKAGKQIQIQSYELGSSIIYVQNTGQGTVHLKQDGSVYINDILKTISEVDGEPQKSGITIPIAPGQTVKVLVNCDPLKPGDRIKVVTVEGTSMETSGHNTSNVSNGNGNTGDSTAPIVSFSFTPTTPSIGETVQFTDTSTAGSGSITHRTWSFGDGSVTNDNPTPTHAYDTTGTKTVSLAVTNSNGKVSTTQQTITIYDYETPSASFTFTVTGTNVEFQDASTAGSGTITQWSWSFGTGASPSTSNIANPTVSYSSNGQKTVTLTVTNSHDKAATTSRTVNIGTTAGGAPTAEFTISNTNPYPGETVTFTDTSTAGTSGSISSRSWNFGDGGTSTARNPTHAYTTPGAKTVTLTVRDTDGQTSTATHTLTVTDYVSPIANFMFDPASPIINQAIAFTDTSTAGSGTINQYAWTFGSDASQPTSTARNPNGISYSTSGAKTVTLTVTDSNGKTGTITQTIQIGTSTVGPEPELLSSSFDGTDWASGWNDSPNPPWYPTATEGKDGTPTTAAKSDPLQNNEGAFTCNALVIPAGTNVIHVSFDYKVHFITNGYLRLYYSGLPNEDQYDPTFTYTGLSLTAANTDNDDWGHYTFDITDHNAFTNTFRFRFTSSLSSIDGELETVIVDNVVITYD